MLKKPPLDAPALVLPAHSEQRPEAAGGYSTNVFGGAGFDEWRRQLAEARRKKKRRKKKVAPSPSPPAIRHHLCATCPFALLLRPALSPCPFALSLYPAPTPCLDSLPRRPASTPCLDALP